VNNKKDFIKKTALDLFVQRGYHATSISEISIKANVSKGLLYHYFDSKEALLKELLYNGIEDLKAKFLYSCTNEIVRDHILFLNCYLNYIEENKSILNVIFQMKLHSNLYLNLSNEINFVFALIHNHFSSVDNSLFTKTLIYGITFNYITENLTTKEIVDMFQLYLDKKEENEVNMI